MKIEKPNAPKQATVVSPIKEDCPTCISGTDPTVSTFGFAPTLRG
jgi:hypothetical protein